MLPAAGRFSPASTAGGMLGESVMVTCRVSETSTVPSFTVRVTVNVVFAATFGATNEVGQRIGAGFANVIPDGAVVGPRVPQVVLQIVISRRCPRGLTVAPSTTSWSAPAFTMGGLLGVIGGASPVRRRIWTPSSAYAVTAA